MKFPKPITIVSLLLLFSLYVSAQEKYSTVKFYPPADRHLRNELLGLLEIDHFMPKDGGIIAELSSRNIEDLKKTGYKYEILVDDVVQMLRTENAKFYAERAANPAGSRVALEQTGGSVVNMIQTPAAFQVWGANGGYYTYAQMITAIDNLVAAHPTLCQKIALTPNTYENRTIYAIKISDNVTTDEAEPEVLYMGLHHAREAIGGSSMIFFMQYLCQQYATNTKIQQLVNNREIFIIPCVNPDGWSWNLSQGAGTSWRKNRRIISGSTRGVDLNRNYSVDWGTCGSVTCGTSSQCGSSTASAETYYSTAAFTEQETQALRNFVTGRNFIAAIDQHAYGPYYSLPYGKTARTLTTEENNIFTYIPAMMAQYNGMRAGNSCQSVGYEVAGGIKDWWLIGDIGMGTKGKIFGMTGEGGASSSYGGLGGTPQFWPIASRIIPLCRGMIYQNLQLAYAAGSYVDVQDLDDIMMTTKTGSLNFRLTRVGLGNEAVNVSMIPLENIQATGATVVVPTTAMPAFHDTYQGNISYTLFPALTNGQRVRFIWRIQTAGYTYDDTVTKFYHATPTPLVNETMDGTFATTWTSSTGFGFTPTGAGMGGGSSKAMSESPTAGSNYTANSTRYATYNSTINLTGATAGYLSFWVRHRAENFRDKLRVQVSNDNFVSHIVNLVGTTTVQEPDMGDGETLGGQPALTGIRPDWTRELYDLTPVLGMNNLRLRFEFTSNPDDVNDDFYRKQDDGFYIDNLKMVSTNAVLVNLLPVNFTSLTGKLLNDNTIRVEWEAKTDAQHDYFEIEKSVDGINFIAIGEERGGAPYKFIDKNPHVGNNYYRIKQHDLDGKITYSKTINVVNNHKVKLTIYPNPVIQGEPLTIKVDEGHAEALTITVSDVQGRIIHSQHVKELPVTREIKINADGWMKQLYVLKIQNSAGELITVQKFVKQ
jgi:carboxypeptidase T